MNLFFSENPLFPALRSGPTAGSGASPKKQIPSSQPPFPRPPVRPNGWLRGQPQKQIPSSRTVRLISVFGVLSLVSILGAVLDSRPVFLLLLSQAGISVVMPMALGGLIYLAARRDLMGVHRIRRWEAPVLAAILAFSIFMSALAIRGLVEDLSKLLA